VTETDSYVHGRGDVLGRILGSKGRAVVVTGDSGVGKSTVLSGAQRISPGLAPPPVAVGAGPGALGRAMSAAVALALALHADDDDGQLRLLRQRMLDAAGQMKDRTAKRAREDLVNLLMDQVRARVGETAAGIIDETRTAWNASDEISLHSRLAALTETDSAQAIAQVASDLAHIADTDVFLALDNVHLLTDEDLRRLRDLVAQPVARVHLRAAYTTVGNGPDEPLSRLTDAGANRVSVRGLDEEAVRSWLAREGISESQAPAVMAVTLGYALHVGDAIRLLSDGEVPGALSDLSQADVVLHGSRRAWDRLSDQDREAALLLLPFAHRPSLDRTSDLLGIEPIRWGVLRQRLREAGVFVDRDDDAWFHELRRQALWQRLDQDARGAVATRLVRWVLTLDSVTYEEVGVLSGVLEQADLEAAVPDDSAKAIAGLSDDAISVAAAVMDLAGLKADEAFVNATGALLRAHERYSAPVDCLPAMRELHKSEAVYLASDDNAAVVTPRWSLAGAVLIAARTLHRTGQVPFQGLGNLAIEVLRSRLGAFRVAGAAVSRFDAAEQSGIAVDLQRQRRDGSLVFGPPPDASLLLALELDGTEIAMTAVYDDTEGRNAAFERLTSVEERVLGGTLKTVLCLRHPLPVVPSRRFVLAAELVLDERLNNRYSTNLRSELTLDSNVHERMERRAQTLKAVRALCSREELLAYDLLEPMGIAWAANDEERGGRRWFNVEAATVAGLDGAHRMADRRASRDDRPYEFMYLAQRAGLRPGQRVTHASWQGGVTPTRSGFLEQLELLVEEAVKYNKQQRRLVLPSDLADVQALVGAALQRRDQDAAELAARVAGLPAYADSKARGMLAIVAPFEDAFGGDLPQFTLATVEFDRLFGDGQRVRLLEDAAGEGLRRTLWEDPAGLCSRYGIAQEGRVVHRGQGELSTVLADLLGHGESEIDTWDLQVSLGAATGR
jgi:hypothetical protein